MLNLIMLIFSILVIFLGFHFMYIGLREKFCSVFYEGIVTIIVGLVSLLFLFM